MAYTDANLDGVKVKRSHLEELAGTLKSLAESKRLTVNLTGLRYEKITAVNITALQTAVNYLEKSFSGNCCQANCCQTCQSASCQSYSCQGCQTCQACQSQRCQSCQRNCNCNCDCDCGDDGDDSE